jgi:hypothetical protein
MAFHWAFSLAVVLATLVLGRAAAQDGVPGHPGLGSVWPTPQQRPPVCWQLLAHREEAQKHGQALQAASREKAPPEEICKLFKVFLAAETTMVNGVEEHRATCGVPPDVIKQVMALHNKALQVAKRVCDAARSVVPLRFAAPAPRFDAPAPPCTEKTLTPGVPCVE